MRGAVLLVIVLAVSPTLYSQPPATIPLVDLSADADRHVVVDREPGQYLGHPTTVLLEDGRTLIAVYPKGHGRGAIVMKRSADGGRTWSGRLPVPDNWATSLETPTIHRVVDARGTRRLILFSGLHPIRMSVSADDGATWTPLAPIGDFGGIVAMSSVVALRSAPGRYLAMFHDDGRFFAAKGTASGTFTLYQTISDDGGLTWSAPRAVYSSSDVHLCEPGIIRSPDGRQLAALLRENRRARNSHVIFSNDDGQTWTAPRELPWELTGDRHTAQYAPDGRLFVSFRDMARGSATRGDWLAWVGTYDDIVAGRPGQYRVRLMDNRKDTDCCYPGVERLPDGTLVTTTYGHWIEGEQPFVASVRLTLPELDARAMQSGGRAAAGPRQAAALDLASETRFAELALACVHREYPNKIAHVLNSDADVRPPRELTPAFYGCYDWHSSVHGHWLLARVARRHPAAPIAATARAALAASLTRERIAGEVRYLAGEGRVSFERPYGLAWLLQLSAELREWSREGPGSRDARAWVEALAPLEREAVARISGWLPKLTAPIRIGEHSQTAFSFGLMLDWARAAGDDALVRLLVNRSRDFYLGDRDCPLSYEPSGEDFLSPCLAEADLVRRVLPPPEFATWLSAFLPRIPANGAGTWLAPGIVTDPTDPKLGHLDGLNLSRAWMLEGISRGLPAGDARRPALDAAAAIHRERGLSSVTGRHYEGSHWLGTFAVYLVTDRAATTRLSPLR